MERVDYDPEIDPSIREAQEEAEREREMSARIRLEIERYVRENDLVPKEKPGDGTDTEGAKESNDGEGGGDADGREDKKGRRERKARLREENREKRAKRAEEGRRAFQSVFTGNILSNPQIVKLLPYLTGVAVLLLLYIANVFHLQTLHRQQQRLDEEIRELSIKAVGYSAERAQQTKRSAIVRKLEEKNIPLKEFPQPLKTIDPK